MTSTSGKDPRKCNINKLLVNIHSVHGQVLCRHEPIGCPHTSHSSAIIVRVSMNRFPHRILPLHSPVNVIPHRLPFISTHRPYFIRYCAIQPNTFADCTVSHRANWRRISSFLINQSYVVILTLTNTNQEEKEGRLNAENESRAQVLDSFFVSVCCLSNSIQISCCRTFITARIYRDLPQQLFKSPNFHAYIYPLTSGNQWSYSMDHQATLSFFALLFIRPSPAPLTMILPSSGHY